MRSHLLHLVLYAFLVSTFFALLLRTGRRDRLRLGAVLWICMVGGAVALAYLMYPFPG
jgi:hypothetical protein